MECPRRPCSRRQVSRPRTPAKILRRSGRRKRLFQKSAIGAPLGYGSLDTCLRWERINCSTGMIATADTDERHSGKPESPDALPQQNRYPKQVVASNKMLPESRIYGTATVRTTAGINKAEDGGRMDTEIGFADALQRVFPTTVSSDLPFRGWICQETLCDGSPVTFDLRQCGSPRARSTRFGSYTSVAERSGARQGERAGQ